MNFKTSSLFNKQAKKLSKKYRNIKNDILTFMKNFDEVHLSSTTIKANLFKTRIKNSDKNSGKSGGYRVYYYKIDKDGITHLLVIYDKSEIEIIDESILEDLIENI
jgi:mRNA-degrading endonuclease RelE of RelBE toxin-antitoxin system